MRRFATSIGLRQHWRIGRIPNTASNIHDTALCHYRKGSRVLSRSGESFVLSDLQRLDPVNNNWFRENSVVALAGRCLLDVLEYLRADPKFPGRFRVVTTPPLDSACLSLSFGQIAAT